MFSLLRSRHTSDGIVIIRLIQLLSVAILIDFLVPKPIRLTFDRDATLNLGAKLVTLSLVTIYVILKHILLHVNIPTPFVLATVVIANICVGFNCLRSFRVPR